MCCTSERSKRSLSQTSSSGNGGAEVRANAKCFSLLFKSGSSHTTVDSGRHGEMRPAGGEQNWQVAFSHAENILELNVAYQSQENVVTEGG